VLLVCRTIHQELSPVVRASGVLTRPHVRHRPGSSRLYLLIQLAPRSTLMDKSLSLLGEPSVYFTLAVGNDLPYDTHLVKPPIHCSISIFYLFKSRAPRYRDIRIMCLTSSQDFLHTLRVIKSIEKGYIVHPTGKNIAYSSTNPLPNSLHLLY